MKSYWIWNYGDYEIYHSNLVNSRREEFGADYPVFWKCYDVDRNVKFRFDGRTERDGRLKLHLLGIGSIVIDGKRYPSGVDIDLPRGDHGISICVMNLTSLPAAYIESDVVSTDGRWYTMNADSERTRVGFEPQYDSPEKTPDKFAFSYKKMLPVSEEKQTEGVLFDFGKELYGPLHIENVLESDEVKVSYGESREEALDYDNSLIFENFSGRTSMVMRGRAFRYIYVRGAKSPKVYAELEYLPLEYRGGFRCGNEDVNRIYDMCAYTLHLNVREVLTEAIKRDRWTWGGDSYQGFKFIGYLFGDKEITRRSLIALRGKEPFDEHISTITDYSFYWVIALWEYYMTYGDAEFIELIYRRAVSLMEFSAKRVNADGFITKVGEDWIFIDWSDIDKDGALCAEQMLWIAANRAMGRLAEVIGRESDAKKYIRVADDMAEKVNKFFWREDKGAYIDTYESGREHVTRHANIFAIMYDIATDAQRESIIKNVIKNDSITKITTPYFEGYELDVMGKTGNFDFIEGMILSYWKGMLDLGATTVWEEYTPSMTGAEHYAMYGSKYGKSLCHMWGASPIYLLGRYYLGVTPTSAGYETFRVEPRVGSLGFIDGKVPVGDGSVSVYLSADKLIVSTDKDGGTLVFGGREYRLEAGRPFEMTL